MMTSLLCFSACGEHYDASRPEVDEETYVMLIAEFEILRQATKLRDEQMREGTLSENFWETPPEATKSAILNHYGVSEQALREAHLHFSSDIDGQKERYRDAIDRVNAAHNKVSEANKDADDSESNEE
jgi:hypothetical protein